MNNVAPILIVLTLIAATLPIVASVFAALMPSSRIKEIDDYFLYARSLDLDSYLKTSVGYSLQVASIYLFFYWTLLMASTPCLCQSRGELGMFWLAGR